MMEPRDIDLSNISKVPISPEHHQRESHIKFCLDSYPELELLSPTCYRFYIRDVTGIELAPTGQDSEGTSDVISQELIANK